MCLSDVQAYMGHADIDTTMLYVHHTPQHDTAERLGRLVAQAETAVAAFDSPRRATSRSSIETAS